MRPIQLHLLSFSRPSRRGMNHLVPTTAWLVPHLRWWLNEANLSGGRAFRRLRPTVTVTTDASLSGWGGATLGPRQVAGCWGPEHSSTHINLLERLAVANARERFRGQWRCWPSAPTQLCARTWELLLGCRRSKVSLAGVHLPGVEKATADTLSRGWVCPTEWTLCPQAVQTLFRLIDRPHVDLFASATNHQLPLYCARGPDPSAWQRNALAFQ